MDWELAMRRQAVTEWRDRQILAAHTMLNKCAQGARNAFEAQLAQATLLDVFLLQFCVCFCSASCSISTPQATAQHLMISYGSLRMD